MTPNRITGLSVLFFIVCAAVLTWAKFGYEPALFYVAGCCGAFLIGYFYDPDRPTHAETYPDHVCSGEGSSNCPNVLAHWSGDELVSGVRR